MRGEKRREREREQEIQWFPPQSQGSIYIGGEDDYLYFILLVV
jgi:hypothetical protein